MANLELSLSEMKAKCRQHGSFYLDPDTVRFWGGKIYDTPNKWGLFVESYDNFDRSRKLYAVKFFSPTASVLAIEPTEIGKTYEHFPDLASARGFRKKLTKALDRAAACYREGAILNSLTEIREEGFNSGIYRFQNEEGDYFLVNTNNFERFICG